MKRAPDTLSYNTLMENASESEKSVREAMYNSIHHYYMYGESYWKEVIDTVVAVNSMVPYTLDFMKEAFIWLGIVKSTVIFPDCVMSGDNGEEVTPVEIVDTLYNRLLKKILYSFRLRSNFEDSLGNPLIYPISSHTEEMYDGSVYSVMVDLEGNVHSNFRDYKGSLEDKHLLLNHRSVISTQITESIENGTAVRVEKDVPTEFSCDGECEGCK